MEEIEITKVSLSDGGSNENSWQELWKKAILNCFLKHEEYHEVHGDTVYCGIPKTNASQV
jgi:hypothetical protein